MRSSSSSGDSGVLPSPDVRGSLSYALPDEAACFRFNCFLDPADGLVFERHGVLYFKHVLLCLGVGAILQQLMQSAGSRHKSIDQFAVERMGDGPKALQCDAILGLALFQL